MKVSEVIDFAPHTDEIKRLVRQVYDSANNRDFKDAEEAALKLVVEAKLLLNAVRHSE